MIGNNNNNLNRYCIIHGHFYQPPRENPWLSLIEKQPSAAPYHNWNERIFDECYRPNAYSRVLDKSGMIQQIHNNYRYLSFNFGPTLLQWIEKFHPEVMEQIIMADAESSNRLNGHGNAIAQVYNHIIMPLSSRRDQLTQIRWAKNYFRSCFNRETEGMWLAETAINNETVRCLIEEGIRYTILSPTQAQAINLIDSDNPWETISPDAIDTRRPYRLYLYTDDGRRCDEYIDVIFFNDSLSRQASFGDLLLSSEILGSAISRCFTPTPDTPEAVIIGTDGETFGHHKPFGDMCLAHFFLHTAQQMNIIPVNSGWYLQHSPPKYEVKLHNQEKDGCAWSCAHGTGRWYRDCGCQTGGETSWNQKWRTPLRSAMQTIQCTIDKRYEEVVGKLISKPWELRDLYKPFCKESVYQHVKDITSKYAYHKLSENEILKLINLLEAQKFMLFSYTSCAWFFSDISGIETIQSMSYACRSLQLSLNNKSFKIALETFLSILETAKSNIGELTGRKIFEKEVLIRKQYRELLCFAATIEFSVLESRNTKFTYNDFVVTLFAISNSKDRDEAYSVFTATIENVILKFKETFYTIIVFDKRIVRCCYVLSSKIVDNDKKLTNDFLLIKDNQNVIKLELSQLYLLNKVDITEIFLSKIELGTAQYYDKWFDSNKDLLEILAKLNGEIPHHLYAPVTYFLSERFTSCIVALDPSSRDDGVEIELRELWARGIRYGVKINCEKATTILQDALKKEMDNFAIKFDTVTCDRMRFYLNIIDRFKLPVNKSKFEDAFYRIFREKFVHFYDEFKSGAEKDIEAKTLLIKLLSFARRMNFNTDAYHIT